MHVFSSVGSTDNKPSKSETARERAFSVAKQKVQERTTEDLRTAEQKIIFLKEHEIKLNEIRL